jgi:L-fuconolactonase
MVSGILDTHVHVWDPTRLDYPWLREVAALDRPMLPAAVELADDGSGGAVFVEADRLPGQAVDEVRWVASLDWPQLRGIVAAAELRAADLRGHLDALAEAGPVVGIRHLLQGEDAERWRDDAALLRGLHAVAEQGWTFDACVRWEQLEALGELLGAVPELPVVIDHLGKPPLDAGPDSTAGRSWEAALRRLAARPGTVVKLSGLSAEAADPAAFERHADAFLARGLEIFGAERAMFGSDWPVSPLLGAAVPTAAWAARVERVTRGLGADWDAVAGRTGARFYGVETGLTG